MDFVEDEGLHGGQRLAAPDRGEQQHQAFRGGDEDVRRMAQHLLALAAGRVAGARPHADPRKAGVFLQLLKRDKKIALNVVVERLQGRHVEHPGRARTPDARRELIQGPEKGGQRLAAARGRGGEYVPASGDLRPSLGLHRRRRVEALVEPRLDRRMKRV